MSQRRLVEGRATARAWRVAAAVWQLTYPFDKGWDTIYVEELGRLANIGDRRDAGRAIKECARLGALEWEPSTFVPPRGQPGRPSLVGLPGAPKVGANHPHLGDAATGPERLEQATKAGALHPHLGDGKAGANHPHNQHLSSVLSVGAERPHLGTHGQGGEGTALGSRGSTDEGDGAGTQAGTPTVGQSAPDLAGLTREQLVRLARADAGTHDAIRAELARREAAADPYADLSPGVRRLFGLDNPHVFDHDERTGDGVGDDERSQMRWRAANASKVRVRERAAAETERRKHGR